MALTNKKQWSEQQRKAGERAFWNQDNEIWFGWNWTDQDYWINKAQGKLPDLTESIKGQVGNRKGEWDMSGFNLDSPLNSSGKQIGMTADPGVRIFDSYQELTDPEGKRAAGYKEQQELFDKMNPLYERYSEAYDKYQGSIVDNDALYQQTKSEWDRQNKAGDAADWSTYENLNKRYEASSQALNMLGAETRNVWDAYESLSKRYADTPEKFDELYGVKGTVYTNPEGRFLKTEDNKFKNLATGNIRTADSFQDLNALARKDESERLAKRFSLAQQKEGVVRGDLETERANKGMTLAERLKQLASGKGLVSGQTVGQKLDSTKKAVTNLAQGARNMFDWEADTAAGYNTRLALGLAGSILSGKDINIPVSDKFRQDKLSNLDIDKLSQSLRVGDHKAPSAQTTITPESNKTAGLFGDSAFGAEGGTVPSFDGSTLNLKSEKTLRQGPGDRRGGLLNNIRRFEDIPSPTREKVLPKVDQLLANPVVDHTLGGIGNVYKTVTGQNPWDQMKNWEKDFPNHTGPTPLDDYKGMVADIATDITTGAVHGTASNLVKARKGLTTLGVPKSGVEETGKGFGRVHSTSQYTLPELKQWGEQGNKKASELYKLLQSQRAKGSTYNPNINRNVLRIRN